METAKTDGHVPESKRDENNIPNREKMDTQMRESLAALIDSCKECEHIIDPDPLKSCKLVCSKIREMQVAVGTVNVDMYNKTLQEISTVLEEFGRKSRSHEIKFLEPSQEARFLKFVKSLAMIGTSLATVGAHRLYNDQVHKIFMHNHKTYETLPCPTMKHKPEKDDVCQEPNMRERCGTIFRGNMPQVPKNWKEVARRSHIKYAKVYVLLSKLNGLQNEIETKKVDEIQRWLHGLLKEGKKKFDEAMKEGPLFVTGDDRVLDGHHRFAALLGLQQMGQLKEDYEVPVVRFEASAENVYKAFTQGPNAADVTFVDMDGHLVGIVDSKGTKRCLAQVATASQKESKMTHFRND